MLKKKNRVKISLITILVIGITVVHYRTGQLQISSHIIFRELYFLPIILAGFWFGMRGGPAVSIAVTLLYLPYVLSQSKGMSGHTLDSVLQIVLFNVIGVVVGWLRDRGEKQHRRMLEAENLAAMGRAVSFIAHDMKTPLMVIGGLVQQVRKRIDDEGPARKLEFAAEQVRRLEAMVGDMLAFARPLQLQYGRGSVAALVEEVVVLVGEKARLQEIGLRTELSQEIPLVEYDPQRLQQAVLNLVNNAVEASPRGGEVTIRCGCASEEIVIEIIDQGEGIPEERRNEIFLPFFTSKKDGTGLGLPIVKKVIDAHAGAIVVDRNADRGTIFRILLPFRRKP